jgi:Leucine-rich repeat (LRR) protein
MNDPGDDGMVPFEVDMENATLNPLRKPSKRKAAEKTATNAHRVLALVSDQRAQDTLLAHMKLPAMSLLFALTYATCGATSILLARHSTTRTGPFPSTLGACIGELLTVSVFETLLINALFILGFVIILWNKNGGARKQSRRVWLMYAIVFACMVVATIAIGPVPELFAEKDKNAAAVTEQKTCKLYKQGYPSSVDKSLYDDMKKSCPEIADSEFFHALHPTIAEVSALSGAINAIASAISILTLFFSNKDIPVESISCQASFVRCYPANCSFAPICNVFGEDFYRLGYNYRKDMIETHFAPERLEMGQKSMVLLAGDPHTQKLLGIFLENMIDGIMPVVYDEWGNSSAESGRFCPLTSGTSAATGAAANGGKTFPCSTSAVPRTARAIRGATQNAEMRAAKTTARTITFVVSSISFLLGSCFFSIVRRDIRYSFSGSSSRVPGRPEGSNGYQTSLALLFTFSTNVFSACLAIYGGSLLLSAEEPRLSFYFYSVVYFCIGVLVLAHYGRSFSYDDEKPEEGEGGGDMVGRAQAAVKKWLKKAVSSEKIEFVQSCLDPKNPEFIYRIIALEALEALLQVGAMLSPQALQNDFVLVGVIVLTANSFSLATTLQCTKFSPSQVLMLLGIEILCDSYFTMNGITRLRSNLNLDPLEHLALIKPIVSFVMDVTDFFVMTHVQKYVDKKRNVTMKEMPRLLVSKLKTFKRKLTSRESRGGTGNNAARPRTPKRVYCHLHDVQRMLTLWSFPYMMLAFATLFIFRNMAINAKCTDLVGSVAHCADKRHYFDVPWGILGQPDCNFHKVTRLECSGEGIDNVTEGLGGWMTNLVTVDLSHNPDLESVPASLRTVQSLRTVDISFSGVTVLPFGVADAAQIRTLVVEGAPVAKRLDWSFQNLTRMPSLQSVFYETFNPTLEKINLHGNKFSGNVPAGVCCLQRLAYVNISANRIETLESTKGDKSSDEKKCGKRTSCNLVEDLPNIAQVDARGNRITRFSVTKGIVSKILPRQSKVYLGQNNISQLSLEQLRDAPTLKTVLQNIEFPPTTIRTVRFLLCRFTATKRLLPWPPAVEQATFLYGSGSVLQGGLSMVTWFSSLTRLEIRGGHLSGNVNALWKMKNLEHIALSNNYLVGTMDGIQNLWKLSYLDLAGNLGLDETLPGISGSMDPLKNLTRLCRIALTMNSVDGSLSGLKGLTALKSLELSTNKFTGDLAPVRHLKSLRYLSVKNNMLTGSIAPLIQLNRTLQRLHICNNRFTNSCAWTRKVLTESKVVIFKASGNRFSDYSECNDTKESYNTATCTRAYEQYHGNDSSVLFCGT